MARPIVYGKYQRDHARRMLSGKCHLLILPDSRTSHANSTSPIRALTRTLRPEKVVGAVTFYGADDSNGASQHGPVSGAATLVTATGVALSPDTGVTLTSPGVLKTNDRLVGTGVANGGEGNTYVNRIQSYYLLDDATVWRTGKWWEGKLIQVRGMLTTENSAGAGSFYFQTGRGGTIGDITISPIQSTAGAARIQIYDVAQHANTAGSVWAHLKTEVGTTLPTNMAVQGGHVRFWTGEVGFQLDVANIGSGYRNSTFRDSFTTYNTLWSQYLAATDTTDIMIGTGLNGVADKATFKQQTLDLIAQIKLARPALDCIWLLGPYPTNVTESKANTNERSDAYYEIAQSDDKCVFLDMYQAFGDEPTFVNQFFNDGAHTDEGGSERWAMALVGMIDTAAGSDVTYSDVMTEIQKIPRAGAGGFTYTNSARSRNETISISS